MIKAKIKVKIKAWGFQGGQRRPRSGEAGSAPLSFKIIVLLACVIFMSAPRAEAAVKITVKNNMPHTVTLAFCWGGEKGRDAARGWYNVRGGETRTINIAGAKHSITFRNFGYYAKGTPSGGETVYWEGESGDKSMEYYIDPHKAFTGGHRGTSKGGGQKVSFRRVGIKRLKGSGRQDGGATVTFNP